MKTKLPVNVLLVLVLGGILSAQNTMTVQSQTTIVVNQETVVPLPASEPMKAMLVVQNHVQPEYRDYMMGWADLLSGELSNRNFAIINPDNVLGVNQNTTAAGEAKPAASATRLAELAGADYVITASLRRVTKNVRGTPPVQITTMNLGLNLNVARVTDGVTLAGQSITVQSPQLTPNKVDNNLEDVFHDMLETASVQASEWLQQQVASKVIAKPEKELVSVNFTCNVPGASLLIDGVLHGTLPAELKVSPGMHNLEVSYVTCVPFRQVATFKDGQTFTVSLELSRDGYLRWKDEAEFTTMIQRIKESGATDDYVRRVMADANAEFLKNSHFRWDGAVQTLTVERPGVPAVIYGPTTNNIVK